MTVRVLAAMTATGYAVALWWVLRRESRKAVLALTALTIVATLVRLVFLHQYPRAYHEVELTTFARAKTLANAIWPQNVLSNTAAAQPALLATMFQGLPYHMGVGQFWAIRGYSLIMSVLSVPLGFAVCRQLGCKTVNCLFGALLFTVLPWAILYGRVNQGGELVFHELLVLWGIAALLSAREPWWSAVAIGSFGLTLLLYSYPPTRVYWHLTLWTAATAARTAKARLGLLLIALIAVAAYVPSLMHPGPLTWCGFWPCGYEGRVDTPWVQLLKRKIPLFFRVFVAPAAENAAHGVEAAAMHPIWLLPFVFIGMTASPWAVGVLITSALFSTAVPTILSYHVGICAHEMLPLFPVISLAAACGLERLRLPAISRATLALVLAVSIAWWSVGLYYSPAFWTQGAEGQFSWCFGIGHGTSADECSSFQ